MPKIEIDYSNTIIYKITCKDPSINDVYVGHTTNFVQRKHAHKQSCKNDKASNYKCKLYDVIRNNGGWENWNMEIINFFNCHDHYEARQKEQEYFILLNATLNSIEPMPKPKPKEIIVPKTIIKETFYCDICDIYCDSKQTFEVHNKTTKHNKLFGNPNRPIKSDFTPKTPSKFACEVCDFKCCKQSDWDRHTSTRKHTSLTADDKSLTEITPLTPKHICSICFKEYKTRVGLWYHTKTCQSSLNMCENPIVIQDVPTENCIVVQEKPNDHINLLTSLVIEVVKNNQELQKQSCDFQKQMVDMCKTMQSSITMNNNCNNNSNNTFNLQVFLNEECKDAINMSDFINSFTVELEDLENIRRLGYATGMSNMIVKELKLLDIYKRPIHCSDLRREIFYVKDNNVWERETPDNSNLKKAICGLSKKNMVKLSDWRDRYPECMDVESEYNNIYVKLMMEVCGGRGDQTLSENKIFKNIAKEVVITKKPNH